MRDLLRHTAAFLVGFSLAILPTYGELKMPFPMRAATGVKKEVKILEKKGDAAFSDVRLAEAREAYDAAAALAPKNYDILHKACRANFSYGISLMDLDDRPAAEVHLNRAVELAHRLQELRPLSAEPPFFLATTYGMLALFKGGKEKVRIGWAVKGYVERAIARDPQFFAPYVVLGVFYRELAELTFWERFFGQLLYGSIPAGSYPEALAALKKAEALNPEYPYIHYELGNVYMKMGDEKNALASFRHFLSLPDADPRDPYLKKLAGEAIADLD